MILITWCPPGLQGNYVIIPDDTRAKNGTVARTGRTMELSGAWTGALGTWILP